MPYHGGPWVSVGREESVYIDCHNDTILGIILGGEDFTNGSPSLHIDLPKILSVPKLGVLYFAAWCDPVYQGSLAVTKSVEILRRIRALAQENSDHLEIAGHMSDVDRIAACGKVSILPTVEGGQPLMVLR